MTGRTRTLDHYSTCYEIVVPGGFASDWSFEAEETEELLDLPDEFYARQFLASVCLEDYFNMRTLRELLEGDFGIDTVKMADHTVVELAAQYLASKQVRVRCPPVPTYAPRAAAPGEPKPVHIPQPKQRTWIEVCLVDQAGNPVSGQRYVIKRPDGTPLSSGVLGEDGLVRANEILPGNYELSFPDLDGRTWHVKAS